MKFFSLTASLILFSSFPSFAAENTKAILRTSNILSSAGKPVGQVTVKETAEGVQMTLNMKGVPAGKHGMHFHQNGKCEGPAFKSAGDHFNPTGKQHGAQNPQGAHLGDLPNLDIPLDGVVKKTILAKGLSLYPGSPQSLATPTGTALVVHAQADDLKSDPSGNSGDRIFCAVIAEAEAAKK